MEPHFTVENGDGYVTLKFWVRLDHYQIANMSDDEMRHMVTEPALAMLKAAKKLKR